MKIKLLGEEISLSTANTVNNGVVIRVVNDTGNTVIITQRDELSAVKGSCSVRDAETLLITKSATDTLESSAAVVATSVAYL